MSSVVIFLDGVMRKDKTAPIRQGLLVYKSLVERQRTIVVCDDKSDAERWFRENNLSKIDDIVGFKDEDLEDPLSVVDRIRSRGNITMVITPDVDLATALLEQGIPSMLFIDPKYIRPEFRPDTRTGAKAWSQLVEELDRQQGLFDDDRRLKDDE